MSVEELRQRISVFREDAQQSHRLVKLRHLYLPLVLLLSVTAGGLTGLTIAYQINSSRAANEVASLASYRPSVITRVYADDNETVIGEFALEKRIPLQYEEIPPNVKNAILAIEDARFYKHVGIDPIRIIGAAYKNFTTGSREGGSTLTQQLAKNLFLSKEQTLERKAKEWLLALQIERFYTKNQIMEMYVNQVFLGANSYGFEAAAQTYFDKHAKDLTLEEAALLAGIPKAPTAYSPITNPEAARARRNLVLDRMAENGFISEMEARRAKARPLHLADTARYYYEQPSTPFDYPVEEIRQYLENKYTTRVAQGGLAVYSTINVEAQKKATKAIREGLRWYDRTHSRWRSAYENIGNDVGAPTKEQLADYKHPDWYGNDFKPGEYIKGLVVSIDRVKNEARVRFGRYTGIVMPGEMGWSKRQPKDEFRVGDLAEFEVKEVNDKNRRLTVELSQVPEVEAALMTLNAHTGAIITMVGGYDFQTSKFNNATQAYRQTGSAFKPFIYTAAIEWGMTPDTIVSGAPILKDDGYTRWQPHNYNGSVGNADMPLRMALAKSMNVPAVHLLETIGIYTGAQMLRRFGVTVPMAPYLPSALGATEVPLNQMVSAYSVFPNKGVRVEPHLIRRVVDRDGQTLEEWRPTTYKVVNEYVALTMVEMMRGVVEFGTAQRAKALNVPLAGKTGTVNDQTDVWFIGYTPTYVTGVWMGYPGRKRSLGRDMTGSRGALPIFVDFMKDFLKDKPKENFPEPPRIPSDLKELNLYRQRQQAEERNARIALEKASKRQQFYDRLPDPEMDARPELERITLPPPPRVTEKPAPLPPAPPLKSKPVTQPGVQPEPASAPLKSRGDVPRVSDKLPPFQPSVRERGTDSPKKRKSKNGATENP